MKSITLAGILAVACMAHADDWKTNFQSLYATNTVVLTSANTPFLIITNRPYVQFEDGKCVVRVTDAEWQSITNHYADKIKTNSITFYAH